MRPQSSADRSAILWNTGGGELAILNTVSTCECFDHSVGRATLQPGLTCPTSSLPRIKARTKIGDCPSFPWISVLLRPAERGEIRRQLRLARNACQRAYIVVRFEEPLQGLVVVPADEAFSARRVNSLKGEIPWDD